MQQIVCLFKSANLLAPTPAMNFACTSKPALNEVNADYDVIILPQLDST